MRKGATYPAESRWHRDFETGVELRQLTSHPSQHHHPFYYLPAFDDAMTWLVFVSHRCGAPQIFAEERSSGRLVQLTDRPDLNEWSIHPSHDGRHVYFTAGAQACRVCVENQREECLAHFGDAPMLPPGMVGDAMGTTALSHDDHYWCVPVRGISSAKLHIVDTRTGRCDAIVEGESIGHPEFHPRDSNLLRYAGPYYGRLRVVNRDGSGDRLAYVRDALRKEWIVHEVWNPLRRELLTVRWPHGVIGVEVDSGAVREVCAFNVWHAAISSDGQQMVCDTTWPDRGLHVFGPQNGSARPMLLCHSLSSNEGAHWRTDHCPYDDGPVQVYAPQHTHPHPSISPDGRSVVFTSDRSGHAQIYECALPASGAEGAAA